MAIQSIKAKDVKEAVEDVQDKIQEKGEDLGKQVGSFLKSDQGRLVGLVVAGLFLSYMLTRGRKFILVL